MSAVATERRRRRAGGGRHAAPPPGRRFGSRSGPRSGIVRRLLVSIATSMLGVVLAATPQEVPRIVRSGPEAGPSALVVLGVALILLAWIPVLDLLLRRRREIHRMAGPWPARVAVVGAVLIPVTMIVEASRSGARWSWAVGAALLMLAQVWGLATLWRRPPGAPDG
jgi:hypothetical protein